MINDKDKRRGKKMNFIEKIKEQAKEEKKRIV